MGWNDTDLKITEEVAREFLENEWTDEPEIYVLLRDEVVVAGGVISFSQVLPDKRNRTGKCAYILNIFVEPDYRLKGLATELMEFFINMCKNRNVGKVSLHSTRMSEKIYERLGFKKSENFYDFFLS
ncbi:MAG: GNAT family N-acetyltransferase [Candidatus Thorarchaeota archaeon]